MKDLKVINLGKFNKNTIKHKELAELLYQYANTLLYPEDDFFEILYRLGLSEITKHISSLDEAQKQYYSLFRADSNGKECLPFALSWVESGLLCKETAKLKRFYEQYGFKFNDKDLKMPWDHISIELFLLANLIENKDYEVAKEMIKEHMGWIEKFKECLKKKSKIYYTIVENLYELLKTI